MPSALLVRRSKDDEGSSGFVPRAYDPFRKLLEASGYLQHVLYMRMNISWTCTASASTKWIEAGQGRAGNGNGREVWMKNAWDFPIALSSPDFHGRDN